jgi:hypothetical protein
MKKCSLCLSVLPLIAFWANCGTADGLTTRCKDCLRGIMRSYRARNAVRLAEEKAQWQRDNKEKRNAAIAKYQKRHPERLAATRAQSSAKRRARRIGSTPAWANRFFIGEAYRLARLRSQLLGYEWEVDHIVPLRSDIVCGLHVEHNLQVIAATDNTKKSNRVWPDMPSILDVRT